MKLLTRALAVLATVLIVGALFAGTSSAGGTGDYFCDELGIGCPGDGGNTGNDSDAAGDVVVTCAAGSSSCPSEGLARTGSNVGSSVAVGAALVLLGGAAVVGARKRRDSA